MRKTPILALFAAGLSLFCSLSWVTGASAHNGYPEVVKTTLGLSAIYDPSGMGTGCYLCHVNTAGMGPLRPFGSLLVESYGLSSDMVNEADQSLVNALGALQTSSNARLITDIKGGVDPNTDPELVANALPTPDYGCVAAPGKSNAGTPALLCGLGLVGLAVRRRRRA